MKTLSSADHLAQISARIAKVTVSDTRRWGLMNAHQMLCHLRDAFVRSLDGPMPSPFKASSIPVPLFKWFALKFPVKWPPGIRTPVEIDQLIGGTQPVDFETDRAALLNTLNEFAQAAGPWEPHPIFQTMTTGEWMRWGYLHVDHHLRQFGR